MFQHYIFGILFFLFVGSQAFGQEIGFKLYEEHCSSCHKTNGKGMMRIYPPLLNSNWLNNDSTLINVILKGLSGPILVNDKKYKGEMPAFSHLSTVEIAEILNFVPKEFGKNETKITVQQIATEKAKLE